MNPPPDIDLAKFSDQAPENQPKPKLHWEWRPGLLLIGALLTVPLWGPLMPWGLDFAKIADWTMPLWRKLTGYQEPESSFACSFHTMMADGSTAHFQIVNTQCLTESID